MSGAVGITVYEKKRGLGRLESIGSEIVWFQIHRDHALDEVREFVGRRTEPYVYGLDRRATESVGRKRCKRVERLLDPAVVAENGRHTDDLAHFFRMTDGDLHRDPAAHAVTEQIGLRDLQVIEQCGNVVGEAFITEIAIDVARSSMALHLDSDDFSGFR